MVSISVVYVSLIVGTLLLVVGVSVLGSIPLCVRCTTHNWRTMDAAWHHRLVCVLWIAAHRVDSHGHVDVAGGGVATRLACVVVGDVTPVSPAIVCVVGGFNGVGWRLQILLCGVGLRRRLI